MSIGLFIFCLPLAVYFMVRVAFGQTRTVGISSSLLIGLSGSVALSYLYFYVGQNSALAITPLLLTSLYLLITRFSLRMLLLSTILLNSFVVMYVGMLPYAVGPVCGLGLYRLIRRDLSIKSAVTIAGGFASALVAVNLGMLPGLLRVLRSWLGIDVARAYFADFVTEQFFPMFLGLAIYPIDTSLQRQLVLGRHGCQSPWGFRRLADRPGLR